MNMEEKFMPEIYKKCILILGCGNILFGDAGFGPEVCRYLTETHSIPENIGVEDCGTGVREVLFDIMLCPQQPQQIVIVDAIDAGKQSGEVFEIGIEGLPQTKIDDFSMHALPTSNLLRELQDDCGIKISILACQTEYIPTEVSMGLSHTVIEAVPVAVRILAERFCLPKAGEKGA